jgi:hypothetical protein
VPQAEQRITKTQTVAVPKFINLRVRETKLFPLVASMFIEMMKRVPFWIGLALRRLGQLNLQYAEKNDSIVDEELKVRERLIFNVTHKMQHETLEPPNKVNLALNDSFECEWVWLMSGTEEVKI